MADANIIILDEHNFENEVLESQVPILVDFWAEWCGPCQALLPIFDELADEYKDKIKVAKLNVDENRSLAMKYRVMSIPTILFFKDGEEIRREVGAKAKSDYESVLNTL